MVFICRRNRRRIDDGEYTGGEADDTCCHRNVESCCGNEKTEYLCNANSCCCLLVIIFSLILTIIINGNTYNEKNYDINYKPYLKADN